VTDTPDIEFTYDRLGRKKTVTDVVGTRTFAYDDGENGDLRLLTETIAGNTGWYSKTITRDYEDSAPHRDAGFHIGTSDYDVDYDYDDYGRLDDIQGTGLPANGVQYTYVSNSDLLDKLEYKTTSATVASADYSYETNRDLMTVVENKAGSPTLSTVSKYTYVYDDLTRRTSVVTEGSAFGGSGNEEHNDYTYNDRSELTPRDRPSAVRAMRSITITRITIAVN